MTIRTMAGTNYGDPEGGSLCYPRKVHQLFQPKGTDNHQLLDLFFAVGSASTLIYPLRTHLLWGFG